MNISNSVDINDLSVKVSWDVSGRYPIIRLENLSQGDNLANVSYAFDIQSPSDTSIYDGNLGQPDITGIWTNFTFYSNTPDPLLSPPPTNYIVAGWPRPFGQIEWSGAPYMMTVLAKDSLGNTWSLPVPQLICRPSGNVPTSITTYGKSKAGLKIICESGNAYFEDRTNTSYKGLSGTQESSQLRVNYPDDETDEAPVPFIINNFTTALVPITFDSDNYEFILTQVYLYDFGNNSFVRIKYYTKERFSVTCNIDLCPLVCEYEKLLQKAESGQCGDTIETTKLLLQINGKMNLAMVAKTQPLCGIDLPALIDEIKELGRFQCDCCTPSGVKPFNSASLGDYNFQIISGGGDISGGVNVVGNNIQFTLYDKNYIFKICDTAETSAFTVTPSISGFTKTYCLNVNMVQFSADILGTIKSNLYLVNLFNSIVDVGSTSPKLIVDGSCIFQSTSSCDYTYTVANVPDFTTYVLVTSIKVGNVVRPLYFAFNLTNLPALQTYLNSLGIGAAVVTNLGSNNVEISFATNTYDLGDLTYQITSTSYIAAFTKNCTGFLPIDASQVVQAIIYYLCGLDDSELVTSQVYTICYAVDNTGGSPPTIVNTVDIPKGTKLNVFISALLDRNCQSINYFATLGSSFNNGITKTGDVVQLGGTLIKDTNIITGTNKVVIANGVGSNNQMVIEPKTFTVIHSTGDGTVGTDLVTVLFQPGNRLSLVSTTKADRDNVSYYARSLVTSEADVSGAAYIGSHYPASNDIILASPPAFDATYTAYVKASQEGAASTGLVEVYGKNHRFIGDHTRFLSYPVLPNLSAAQIAAIAVGLLESGMMVYNTNTQKINFWDGGAWRVITST